MLNMIIRVTPNTIIDVGGVFNIEFENEWITHPLSRQMIHDIDKSTVINDRIIDSPILGMISPRELSGGVKALMLMLFEPELEYYGTACGDNCAKWILEIAKLQDIFLAYENIMSFPEPFEIKIVNSGAIVRNMHDLIVEVDKIFIATERHLEE